MPGIVYPERLSLALLPTPLQPLDRFSRQLGGPRLWVKRDDLTGSLATGNKIRKLEFIFAQALATGCGAVVTCGGLQSNHCRATAILAAQLGLQCTLVLRGDRPEQATGNLLLDAMVGAEIRYVPESVYYQELSNLLEEVRVNHLNNGINCHVIPTGGSDGIGVWGYVGCAEELADDCQRLGVRPSHIVHATGSGGTQAGLTLGVHLAGLEAEVVAINVCDDEPYFQRKVRQDLRDWKSRYGHLPGCDVDIEALTIRVIDSYVGAGYAKASDDVLLCIAELARSEGIILDPVYTGKAFHGLVQEIRRGRFAGSSDLVFVHTGGIFGIYPYAADFNRLLHV